jgi:hypothetical protein
LSGGRLGEGRDGVDSPEIGMLREILAVRFLKSHLPAAGFALMLARFDEPCGSAPHGP